MELEPLRQLSGGRRVKRLIKRTRRVRVQIILDHPKTGHVWILRGERLHELSIIGFRPAKTHLGESTARQWFDGQQETADAMPFILGVLFFRLSRLHRQRGEPVANELTRSFINADHRLLGIIRLRIQIEQVFQAHEVFPRHMGDAPLPMLPGFQVVFLSRRLTVVCDMESTTSSSTRRWYG